MLVWKDEYSIGVDLIDAQHKHIFEIGNSAYKLLRDDISVDKYDKVVQIIDDLREYTKFHFRSEEDYMLEVKYSGYYEQKKEHDAFIKKIDEVDLDLVDKDPEKYLEGLLTFIFTWVLDHVIKKDKLIK
ncbi:MAG: bacteriohemerythrin [Bacillota bacterium]